MEIFGSRVYSLAIRMESRFCACTGISHLAPYPSLGLALQSPELSPLPLVTPSSW